MMSLKGLYYFAHPYTVRNAEGQYVAAGEEANFRLCAYRAWQLIKRGYNVYAPICHTHPIHASSPELLGREEHALWYAIDEHFMDHCEFAGIILAPDWEQSYGCCRERKLFEEKGLDILLYAEIVGGKDGL